MRKYRLCLLVILIAFCIQGCSKQQDVEDHSFVLAMGFERINEKKLLVRYSYADSAMVLFLPLIPPLPDLSLEEQISKRILV